MTSPSRISLTRKQEKALLSILPEDRVITASEKCAVYGVDAGRKRGTPAAVLRPKNTKEVQGILSFAQKERLPVHPRARGTNMVGACVPENGGIVISCLELNRILEVDERDYVACVQPGVVTGDFNSLLEDKGLFYPPDPASVGFSTLGGNVSTNAGGMRAVKYGVTRDYVLGVEAVLPGGRILQTGGRCHKDVVGLDLTGLFVGSEGGLGFITRIWLKLLPRPAYTSSLFASFASLDEALSGVDTVLKQGILPVAMEIMPDAVLDCLRELKSVHLPEKSGAALLLKMDGNQAGVREDLRRAEKALHNASIQVADPEEEERLWEPRRLISQASYRLKPNKISEDIAVPRGRLHDYVRAAAKIGKEQDLPVLVFGHAGDGNMHTNIMYDENDAGECIRAERVREDILSRVLALGGTVSGEHGIGQGKREYLSRQLTPLQLELMRGVKGVFDPLNIMNPVLRY